MLPATHRLRDATTYRRVLRRGRRRTSATLVAAVLVEPGAADPLVGLIVSRAVGNAVVRNRVKRRLRHLCADRLAGLPPGTRVVLRALPSAGAASSGTLGADLDRCLETLVPA